MSAQVDGRAPRSQTTPRRVHITTLGCRTNLADSLVLEDELRQRGVAIAGANERADVVIVNSCTVTHGADADARKLARRFRRKHPDAQIVVTGCYAQVAPEELRALPEIDAVVGNDAKPGLIAALIDGPADGLIDRPTGARATATAAGRTLPRSVAPTTSPEATTPETTALETTALRFARRLRQTAEVATPGRRRGRDWQPRLRPARSFVTTMPETRTRPFLKVQDGCDYSCAFCIIPTARGVSRSLSLQDVTRDALAYAALGARELVLTGIHLGHWGRDMTPRRPFAALVEALATALERDGRVRRLRLGSVEPNEVTPALITLLRDHPLLCEHVHIPLQSGDDATLRRMRRLYRAAQWRETVTALREAMPDAAIGADVLVGHPGEDNASFERTLAFLDDTPWSYLHVFPFSARRGTASAQMDGQVAANDKAERVRQLTARSAERRRAFHEARVGRTFEAIVLDARAPAGTVRALTRNYIPVQLDLGTRPRPDAGTLLAARLIDAGSQRCRAEVAR